MSVPQSILQGTAVFRSCTLYLGWDVENTHLHMNSSACGTVEPSSLRLVTLAPPFFSRITLIFGLLFHEACDHLAHCLGSSGPPDPFFLDVLFTQYRSTALSHTLINDCVLYLISHLKIIPPFM